MSEGCCEVDRLMDALRLSTMGIVDEVQGLRVSAGGLMERVIAVEERLQNALVGVNNNFVALSNTIETHQNVSTKLVGVLNRFEKEQQQLWIEVNHGKEWSQQMEDGTLAVLVERLEKLENRIAEKDEEIAMLRGQMCSCRDAQGEVQPEVGSHCCTLVFVTNDCF
jgi:predicted RNase H-like nuclease (RuvC/YqgF family)